jgi:hypothetical protein
MQNRSSNQKYEVVVVKGDKQGPAKTWNNEKNCHNRIMGSLTYEDDQNLR